MHPLRWLTAPLAPLYSGMVALRNRAFDRHPERITRVAVPVISVGNLSTGGTGKTPVTLHLAQRLAEAGWPNAIISRGYRGKRDQDPQWVHPDGDPTESGDEPMMMARRLGEGRIVVARKRAEGACLALEAPNPARCLLLDDGFQHRQLHRDLDLLLLDGVRRWGNGRMLPLGDLREPMTSASRAQALIVTRSDRGDLAEIESWWARHGSGGPVFPISFRIAGLRAAGPEPHPAPSSARLAAFCGLGHPSAFYEDLGKTGHEVSPTLSLGDHMGLKAEALGSFAREALSQGAAGLVCTEKDAVKLQLEALQRLPLPLWIAEQEVVGAEGLVEFVLERLSAW